MRTQKNEKWTLWTQVWTKLAETWPIHFRHKYPEMVFELVNLSLIQARTVPKMVNFERFLALL